MKLLFQFLLFKNLFIILAEKNLIKIAFMYLLKDQFHFSMEKKNYIL